MNHWLKTLLALGSIITVFSIQAAPVQPEPVPKDLVEFTCQEFADHTKDCQPYKCQAPYAQDPSIKTEWEIVKTENNRCVITDTTDDIGLKDDNDHPVPVKRTCEYNEEAIEDLIKHLEDIELGFFSTSANSQDDGKFNCHFTANDMPIQEKDYTKSLREDSVLQ